MEMIKEIVQIFRLTPYTSQKFLQRPNFLQCILLTPERTSGHPIVQPGSCYTCLITNSGTCRFPVFSFTLVLVINMYVSYGKVIATCPHKISKPLKERRAHILHLEVSLLSITVPNMYKN